MAWEITDILHRDVSELNVVLWSYIDIHGDEKIIGMLIDWDLAKKRKFLNVISRPGRSVSQSLTSKVAHVLKATRFRGHGHSYPLDCYATPTRSTRSLTISNRSSTSFSGCVSGSTSIQLWASPSSRIALSTSTKGTTVKMGRKAILEAMKNTVTSSAALRR